MATEEPNPVAAAAQEGDGVRDFGASGSSGSSGSLASNSAAEAAAAAAAVVAQLSGGTKGDSCSHAFSTLFIVDFTFVKAGNLMEVVEMSWITFDVETRQTLEEASVFVRPEQLLAPAETLAKLGVTQEELSAAETLGDVVQKFDSAVFQKCEDTSRQTMLCAFDREKLMDFRACAAARQVALFPHYAQFVDLKHILRTFMHRKSDMNRGRQ